MGLQSREYFPAFKELPETDEVFDTNYYQETSQGMLMPSKTWTFVCEIVNDSLSQMPVLGHRVEVRDIAGCVTSVLFYPESGFFNFSELRAGHTLFIRYAQRSFFSDLATEAVAVKDLNFVKTIPSNLDALFFLSQAFFEYQQFCICCRRDMTELGGSVVKCSHCEVATYCSNDCCNANAPQHQTFCSLCAELGEVLNIDFERFTNYVGFRK